MDRRRLYVNMPNEILGGSSEAVMGHVYAMLHKDDFTRKYEGRIKIIRDKARDEYK